MRIYSLFNRDGSFNGVIFGAFQYVIAPTIAEWNGFHFEGEYDDSYYFHDGEPTKRPQNPTTLNNLVLSDVPKGSTIHIDGEPYECENGGKVTLQFNQAGVYVVQIESFPYLNKEFTIDYQP